MGFDIDRPKLEGNIAIDNDRQIGFAEFGDPQGRAVFWLHGTPGARRQIPAEARVYAGQHHIRLIGVDRPGIGSSTPHQYDAVLDFGARPAGHRRRPGHRAVRRHRTVRRWAVLAGVCGGHARAGGDSSGPRWRCAHPGAGRHQRWCDDTGQSGRAGARGGRAAGAAGRGHPDQADPAGRLPRPGGVRAVSPEGDRRLLGRPEFKAMFLDDLLNGSRKQLAAPFADVVVFARPVGVPARRGQGSGALVARRPRPHHSVRAR